MSDLATMPEVRWLDAGDLPAHLNLLVRPAEVVLDLGSGVRPQTLIQPRLHICCEPHAEYVTFLQDLIGNDPGFLIIQATALECLRLLPARSVDSICLIDLIEHLPRPEGEILLAECARVARQQIILFTPLGFMPQEYERDEEDGWGFRGSRWQQHRSGWVPEDFNASWTILACRDFHKINGKGESFDPPHGAFWAIKNFEPSAEPPAASSAFNEGDRQLQSAREQLGGALLQIQKLHNQLGVHRGELARQAELLAVQEEIITRLRNNLEDMESSRAWRFTCWLSRLYQRLRPGR